MKQGAGVAAVLAVAIAAMRLGGGASAPVQGTTTASLTSPQQHGVKGALGATRETGYRGGCTAFNGRTKLASAEESHEGGARIALDRFFHRDASGDKAATAEVPIGVRYAIALAPDPRHTNLSLSFDREMVAIQQAAQDDGYTYDSSWMPWGGSGTKYPLLGDQRAADTDVSRREACPGMLLFRKSLSDLQPEGVKQATPYGEALVVLVVGEQPTGGVNEDQWGNALHWLGENAGRVNGSDDGYATGTLRILGPSFSGSLVSLERNLESVYGAVPSSRDAAAVMARFPRVSVLSGSVSSCSSIHWFQGRLHDAGLSPTIQFGSFQENDELQIYRFFSYLKQLGTDIRDTAVLSEDETAYANSYHPVNDVEFAKDKEKAASRGRPAGSACDFPYADESRPLRLSYPRDISALRTAYEKQSVFAGPSHAGGVHAILQTGIVEGGDGAEGSDTIKSFAGGMGPVDQEAVLYGIVSYLRAHHTRYLLLRCTNPLDFLFLTRFFHRAYPEGRVVMVGSDLLYRREIDTTEFRGVMALTGFPLLPLNQHWSGLTAEEGASPSHVHRVFESHLQGGAYLAGHYLFEKATALPKLEALPKPKASVEAAPPTDAPCLVNVIQAKPEETMSLPWREGIPDYAAPFWLHRVGDTVANPVAPTWVTVVGRDGYWPVAVLNKDTTPTVKLDDAVCTLGPGRPAPPSTLVRLAGGAAHYQRGADPSSFYNVLLLKFPLSWRVCVGSSLLLLYQVFGIMVGGQYAYSTGLFSVFRRFDSPSQSILLGINSAFAAMLFLVPLSAAWTVPEFSMLEEEAREFLLFLVIAVVLLAAFVAVVLIVSAFLVRKDKLKNPPRPGHIVYASGAFAVSLLLLVWVSTETFYRSKLDANAVPIFYRMADLTAGVSPLLPLLFLLGGMYLWTWQALAGNALRSGRPRLPLFRGTNETFGWVSRFYKWWKGEPLDTEQTGWNSLSRSKYRISFEMGKRIMDVSSPVSLGLKVVGLPLLLSGAALVFFHKDLPLLGLESRPFVVCFNLALLFAFFLTSTEAARLFWTWHEFKRLLTELSRLRLRRTFAKLRAVDANSLWSVSGRVHHVQYLFFSQQLDAVIRLARAGGDRQSVVAAALCGRAFASRNANRINNGPQWEEEIEHPETKEMVNIRVAFADATADVINTILWPAWAKEMTSLSLENCAAGAGEEERQVFDMELSKDEVVRTAEEFVCFQYMAFLQNILARMRTMTLSMIFLFLAVCFSISFYPFVPRTQIGLWMLVNLLLIGGSVIFVYAGMERDETLSYIANTKPGRLSPEFWIKTAGFLAGPVIGLLTTQFPSIAESVLGWLQPGLNAIK